MPRVIRSATIQARVLPTVKEASERILWQIGLNMSEAIELFLRRVIVDEALPFTIVAVGDDKTGALSPLVPHDGAKKESRRTRQPKRAPPLKKN